MVWSLVSGRNVRTESNASEASVGHVRTECDEIEDLARSRATLESPDDDEADAAERSVCEE